MLENTYNVFIYKCFGAPGHGREAVNGFNDIDKNLNFATDRCFRILQIYSNPYLNCVQKT